MPQIRLEVPGAAALYTPLRARAWRVQGRPGAYYPRDVYARRFLVPGVGVNPPVLAGFL